MNNSKVRDAFCTESGRKERGEGFYFEIPTVSDRD